MYTAITVIELKDAAGVTITHVGLPRDEEGAIKVENMVALGNTAAKIGQGIIDLLATA